MVLVQGEVHALELRMMRAVRGDCMTAWKLLPGPFIILTLSKLRLSSTLSVRACFSTSNN